MPQLAQVFGAVLSESVEAVNASERKHLLSHVAVLTRLAGREPTTEDLLAAYEAGWLPDFHAAVDLTVSAQLAMTTSRERTTDAGGSVQFGPLRIEGRLAESFSQGTTTNLSVSATLRRESRGTAIAAALAALGSGGGGGG